MKKIFIILLSLVCFAALCFNASAKPDEKEATQGTADVQTQQPSSAVPDMETAEVISPGRPEGLTLIRHLSGEVTLSWDKAENAHGYKVYIKHPADEKYSHYITVKDNSLTVSNMENEVGIRFRVRAFLRNDDKTVYGKYSKSVALLSPPDGVKEIFTRNIDNDSVTLYWNKAQGATGYRVYIFDKEKDKFVIYTRTPRTTATVSGLKKDKLYTFKILSYKKSQGGVSFGTYSEEYKEYTYNAGALPHTKAQAAQYYNNHLAKLKAQQNMDVKYKKSIDTEFISCSKSNLAVSVKNTLNLFEGSLKKTYKYVGGKNDSKSANRLIEPYGKTAALERDDIKVYSAEKKGGSIILKITLKSENKIYSKGGKKQKSYYDGVLSLPDYKTLKTAPLSIESADSYYGGGTLTLKVTDRKAQVLKVNAAVLSDITFTVSSVRASTIVGYELNERYEIIYN